MLLTSAYARGGQMPMKIVGTSAHPSAVGPVTGPHEEPIMIEGQLRGSRLGASSYENESYVEYAERQYVTYQCPEGHRLAVPMSVEAEEIPYTWECRCGREGHRTDVEAPEAKAVRTPRSHWDMLLERRTIADLEELLHERLELLHAGRGSSSRKKSA